LLAAKRKRIESGNYEGADSLLQWLQKDLHLASVSAYESVVAMPLTNVAKEITAWRFGREMATNLPLRFYRAEER